MSLMTPRSEQTRNQLPEMGSLGGWEFTLDSTNLLREARQESKERARSILLKQEAGRMRTAARQAALVDLIVRLQNSSTSSHPGRHQK